MPFLLAVLSSSLAFRAEARWLMHETRDVPIGRLFTNLQARLARQTNSFELTYDLARLHSMAYATDQVTVFNVRTNDQRPEFYSPDIDSGVPIAVSKPQDAIAQEKALRHLTNAILLYERAILLLKKATNEAPSKEWMVLPLELGHAWCLDQAGRRAEAIAAYRKVLALAWRKEVTGDFSFKEWVQDKWEAAKAGRNPLSASRRRDHIGPGACFSEETIRYLLPLLDPAKDAKEIADLRDRQKMLQTMGRAVTPIVVPLTTKAAFEELVDRNAAVAFDLDGSGLRRPWSWITEKAAWLVFDAEGSGQITSGLQMFGNVTFWIFWRNGYEALRSLDNNQDGVLRGSELHGLALWHDRNSNGVSDPGEVRPVTAWGIIEISCANETHPCGMPWSQRGVAFANGDVHPTYDWIARTAGF